MKFARVAVALAAATALTIAGAPPANATVTATDGVMSVAIDSEPNTMNVGDSDTFTITATPVGAALCDRSNTINLTTTAGLSVTPTTTSFGRTGCGVAYTYSLSALSAGVGFVYVQYKYGIQAPAINLSFLVNVVAPDVQPPNVTIHSPVEGASYFLGSVPTPDYTCTDDVALASCTDSGYSSALGSHTMSVTGVDTSGNTTISSVTYQVIPVPDTTPPVVTITSPVNGAEYVEGEVPAPAFTCTDDVEVAFCFASGYSTAVGTHTMSVTSEDTSGNTAAASVTYTVVPAGPTYTFGGFYEPVDMGGVINTVKAGKTVPLKFDLYADGVEVTDPALVSFSVAPSNVCAGATNTDAVEFTTTGGSSLRYDALTGQFVQNWKTPSVKGCYAVTASAGSASITAYFLTK